MNEPIDMDLICNVFLQTVNQYGQLEKHLHTADQELCLSEIHTVAAVGGAGRNKHNGPCQKAGNLQKRCFADGKQAGKKGIHHKEALSGNGE